MFFLLFVFPAAGRDRIVIRIPSPAQEAEYIWQTLRDIRFFEEHNYRVSLPPGRIIETLTAKAKKNELSEKDLEDLKDFIRDSVYRESDYRSGYDKITTRLGSLNRMVDELEQAAYDWHFTMFDTYTVNLTLYGPGGSYDTDKGSVLLYTTPDGKFRQGDDPAMTIIHEIVHIGIEDPVVKKYNVPHPLKERIVDLFVSLSFKEYLPGYRVQEMGENRIDRYLRTKEDLRSLPRFVADIMKQ